MGSDSGPGPAQWKKMGDHGFNPSDADFPWVRSGCYFSERW